MRMILWAVGAMLMVALTARAEELSFEGPNAFRLPREGMNTAEQAKFNYGRGLFHYHWDPLVDSGGKWRGLGPLYNAASCESCHLRDGRGLPPEAADDNLGALVLLLANGQQTSGGLVRALPDPVYGQQVQDRAVDGIEPEARVFVVWTPRSVPDDAHGAMELRSPEYQLRDLAHGPLAADVLIAPRMAPQLIGLGLLADIPEAAIMALSDPGDRDGDGISGRINQVQAIDADDVLLGRFGWKATIATVRQQSDHAATFDIGLTMPGIVRAAGDCMPAQTGCSEMTGDAPLPADFDMDENQASLLAMYTANLAVPPRRITNADMAARGESVFGEIGCAACHVANHFTASGERIAPYTDLLLHDMGEGLADGYATGRASGSEWRTPPLWGIGRTEEVSGGAYFLHDGRARGLVEAILWHGGEAIFAQRRFREMSDGDRTALLEFLNSL